jgi:hypothetical protein
MLVSRLPDSADEITTHTTHRQRSCRERVRCSSAIQCIVMMKRHSHKGPIVAVGGVVYRRTRCGQLQLLLIKKRAGFWTLPKGRVLPGEAHADGIAREVSEETGISGAVETTVRQISYEIRKKGEARIKLARISLGSS